MEPIRLCHRAEDCCSHGRPRLLSLQTQSGTAKSRNTTFALRSRGHSVNLSRREESLRRRCHICLSDVEASEGTVQRVPQVVEQASADGYPKYALGGKLSSARVRLSTKSSAV